MVAVLVLYILYDSFLKHHDCGLVLAKCSAKLDWSIVLEKLVLNPWLTKQKVVI